MNQRPDIDRDDAIVSNRSVVQYFNILNTNKKITADMSDEERYEVLKDKVIQIIAKTNEERIAGIESNNTDTKDIQKINATQRKKLVIKIGKEFGVFKEY